MSRKAKSAAMEERRKTVAANLVAGLNYRDIAGALGVSVGTVASDVKMIMGRWRADQVREVNEVVQLDLRRLDNALNAIWDNVHKGDDTAIGTMLRILERRAKLLGLDKPLTVNFGEMSNADLIEFITRTIGSIGAGGAGSPKPGDSAPSTPTPKLS